MSDFSSPTVMGPSPIQPINPTRTRQKCQISNQFSNLPSIHCTVTRTCIPCIARSRVQQTITYCLTYHLCSSRSLNESRQMWLMFRNCGSIPDPESGPPPAPSKRFRRRIPDKLRPPLITGVDRIIQNWVGGSVAGECDSKCKETLYVRERSSGSRLVLRCSIETIGRVA